MKIMSLRNGDDSVSNWSDKLFTNSSPFIRDIISYHGNTVKYFNSLHTFFFSNDLSLKKKIKWLKPHGFFLKIHVKGSYNYNVMWTASSEFGTYRLCEQRRFRRACASAQSHQNLRCSLIQAVSQEEPSDRKPDPWPL